MTEPEKVRRRNEQVETMWSEPFLDLAKRIMGTSGETETAKAILNARAIAATTATNRKLVLWSMFIAVGTWALVVVSFFVNK